MKSRVEFRSPSDFEPHLYEASALLRTTGTVILTGHSSAISQVKKATKMLQLHLRGVCSFLLTESSTELTRQLSLPTDPFTGRIASAEIIQDLGMILQTYVESSGSEESEEESRDSDCTEVMVSDEVASTAAEVFRVLHREGKVTISGVNTDIPNVALVLEQVREKFIQVPETLMTKISVTIALPGITEKPTNEVSENISDSEVTSQVEDQKEDDPVLHAKGREKYVKFASQPLVSIYPAPGELFITYRKTVDLYIAEIKQRLEKNQKITLKGTGSAVNHTVVVAESVKKVIPGLYQITRFGSRPVEDVYEPTEYGLDTVRIERKVPILEILLSLRPLDSSDPGYQSPDFKAP